MEGAGDADVRAGEERAGGGAHRGGEEGRAPEDDPAASQHVKSPLPEMRRNAALSFCCSYRKLIV